MVVVGVEVIGAPELEAGDEEPTGAKVPGDAGNHVPLGPSVGEERHVAGHHGDVEGDAEVEAGEVRLDEARPEPRVLAHRGIEKLSGDGQHGGVTVDADDHHTSAGELERDPPGPAPGIEHRLGCQGGDEVRLAVHVLAGAGESVEALLVPPPVETSGEGELAHLERGLRSSTSQRYGGGGMGGDGERGESVLSVEVDGHVATVFLDREEKMNALGTAFFAELPSVFGTLGSTEEVRAVVLAARGPHFSVGTDLHAFGGIAAGEGTSPAAAARRTREEVLRLQEAIGSVARCRKPVVAAVHGACIGAGVDLVSACDLRVCSRDAYFSVRETKMAMVADLGTLARLPLLIPMGFVAELVYTGKDADSAWAERAGLVNAVYPDADATLEGARGIAREIAANSPLAVEGSKEVLAEARRNEMETAQRYVASWNAGMLRSDDLSEAVAAFFEKRPPRFGGR